MQLIIIINVFVLNPVIWISICDEFNVTPLLDKLCRLKIAAYIIKIMSPRFTEILMCVFIVFD